MTGDSTASPINVRIRATRRPLLQKPFPIDLLISSARHVLRKRGEPAPSARDTEALEPSKTDSPRK